MQEDFQPTPQTGASAQASAQSINVSAEQITSEPSATPTLQAPADNPEKTGAGAIILGLLIAIPLLIISPFLELIEAIFSMLKNKWALAGFFVVIVLVAMYLVGSGLEANVVAGK